MNIGDRVVITWVGRDDMDFFDVGHQAILVEETSRDIWYADFNGTGNDRVVGDGTWWIGMPESRFELAED